MASPLLLIAATLLLTACASAPTPHGEVKGAPTSGREMGQSDTNRMATLAMRDNLDSLYRLMEKLYRAQSCGMEKTAVTRERCDTTGTVFHRAAADLE